MSTDDRAGGSADGRSGRTDDNGAGVDRTPSSREGTDDESALLEIRDLKTHFPVNTGLFDSLRLDLEGGGWPFRLDDTSVRAVDGVDLELRPGETLGVVGESGCGKSTLARTVLGLEEPTDGDIRFDGRAVGEIPEGEFRERTQMVFQDPQSSLNPRRKVGHIIEDPLRGTGWPESDPAVVARADVRTEGLGDLAVDVTVDDEADKLVDPVDGVADVLVTVRRTRAADAGESGEFDANGADGDYGSDADGTARDAGSGGDVGDRSAGVARAEAGDGIEDELRVDLPWGFEADVRVDGDARTVEVAVSVGVSDKEIRRERALDLLEQVGLKRAYYNRYPHEFSGGQRQRINLARALSVNPDLVVADEPVSGLDVSIQAQILNLMEDLQDEYGLTYLFISHDLSVVRYVADRVAVMYLGEFVEVAPTDQLFADQYHPYARALLSAIPNPDPDMPGARSEIRGAVPSASDPPRGCRFHTRCPDFILPDGFTREGYDAYESLLDAVRDRGLEGSEPAEVLDGHLGGGDGVPPQVRRTAEQAVETALAGDWDEAAETLAEFESVCQAQAPALAPVGESGRASACHLSADSTRGDGGESR
ncbi:oligopeptide/dipeptide ABC transporter ATP-binding protein [Halovivax sp.]|uniref:ABC transporter ATP-binding protein n=1 Tax=Halovivax sp. TaxID=1935978 RepID=UPI0025BC489D|nr:oligopeptide/dipeptide ABC transporter ATP-binding protein [Halovivax sp.]